MCRVHRPEDEPCDVGREPAAEFPTADFEEAGLLCEGEEDVVGRPSAADADCRRSLEREPGLDDEPDGAAFSKTCSDARTRHAVPPPGSGLFLGAPVSSTCSAEVEARAASRFLRETGGSAAVVITAFACDQCCVSYKSTLPPIARGAKG